MALDRDTHVSESSDLLSFYQPSEYQKDLLANEHQIYFFRLNHVKIRQGSHATHARVDATVQLWEMKQFVIVFSLGLKKKKHQKKKTTHNKTKLVQV